MIDYSKWKEKNVNVTMLKLDNKNPRFTNIQREVTQNDLINEMIVNYKVYDLAKSIAEDGFFPDKNLICLVENTNYVVVEGNRRLAALKALLTPEIVIEKFYKRFKRLNSIIETSYILKIDIIIAPSRESANPIVFKEHTDRTSIPWSRIMQAEFYKTQLENEVSLDELASKYNKTKPEITSFLKMINMYEIACNLDYSDKKYKEGILNKQGFNASVLERIYDSQIMKDCLRFDFNSYGEVKGFTNKEDFKKAYAKVIEDIQDGNVNTRKLNKREDFEKYKEGLINWLPTSSGIFTQKDLLIESPIAEKIVKTTKSKTKKTVQKTSGIIPPGIPFTLEGATNLKYFYKELKRMPVKTYPNSVAATLRAFLDKSIRMLLKKKKIKKLSINENGVIEEKKLEDLSLGNIIDCIIKKDVNILEDDNIKKILRQFKSSPDKVSLNALNSIMHNEEYSLKEEEVRKIWDKLEGVFREILTEPK